MPRRPNKFPDFSISFPKSLEKYRDSPDGGVCAGRRTRNRRNSPGYVRPFAPAWTGDRSASMNASGPGNGQGWTHRHSASHGQNGVEQLVQGPSEVRIGAEFLPEPDKHQRLDDSVPVEGFHVALHDDVTAD